MAKEDILFQRYGILLEILKTEVLMFLSPADSSPVNT